MPLNDFRSIVLPYCIEKQPDGGYVALNREYKPLGFLTKEYIQYADYPLSVKYLGLTATVAAKISCDGERQLDRIYLYNDACIPTRSAANMKAYLQRIETLAKLKAAPKK